MPEQQEQAAPRSLSDEIEASFASVWARYVGARPTDVEIELDGSVVRMILPGGTEQFKRAMGADAEPVEGRERPLTVAGYEREVSKAVSKTTRRRVDAMISKHNAKTGIATEVFILEPPRKRY